MRTSPDTVLRLVRAIPLPARAPPQILGVDDWARRKGQTYGTILVDLEGHRVVDLLPDRMAQTLATWLQEHDTVSVIARDRSTVHPQTRCNGIGLDHHHFRRLQERGDAADRTWRDQTWFA